MQTRDRLIKKPVHMSILCITDQTEALMLVVCTHTLLAKVQWNERDLRPISTNSYHEQILEGEELHGPTFMAQCCSFLHTQGVDWPRLGAFSCWSPGRWPD